MDRIKQAYSAVMRGIAASGALEAHVSSGKAADAYGWRRWSASLLAIHDVDRMMALDIPWWNVAATREIEQFLAAKGNARVFEYGSGASTAWLAKRSAEVVAVEHHVQWHRRISTLVEHFPNVTLMRRDLEGSSYVEAIAEVGGTFDLVVIDGRRRADCLEVALGYLAPGGKILFDDTGRKRYSAAIAASGLRTVHHFGRSYCVPYPDHSSILHG